MRNRYWLIYLLLVVAQILLGNFLNLGQLVTICLLPMLVLSLPVKYPGALVMGIAFGTSLAVDFLTHGILGLSTVALLPVAAFRRILVSAVFGEEVFARGEDLSVGKQGGSRMALAILICTAVYFAVFVWVDAAGTRSFGICALDWLLSTLASTAVGIPAARLFNDNGEGRWR